MKQILCSIALLAFPALAMAESLPHILVAGHKTENNFITVDCESAGPQKARCSFTQVLVRPPNHTKLKEETAALSKGLLAEAKKRGINRICQEIPKNEMDGPELDRRFYPIEAKFLDAVKSACKQKSVDALIGAFRSFNQEIESKRCEFLTTSWESIFTRRDPETWVSISTRGLCNVTLVQTLWKEKDSGLLWNYRSAKTYPPTQSDKTCREMMRDRKAEVADYSWKFGHTRDLGCKYLKF